VAAGRLAPGHLADHPKVAVPEVPDELADQLFNVNCVDDLDSLGRAGEKKA
jgi:hypothetical protein